MPGKLNLKMYYCMRSSSSELITFCALRSQIYADLDLYKVKGSRGQPADRGINWRRLSIERGRKPT